MNTTEHRENYGIEIGDRGAISKREAEVLLETAMGFTAEGIGEHLHISPRTVECHLAGSMNKLGAHNRASLISRAFVRGVLVLSQNTVCGIALAVSIFIANGDMVRSSARLNRQPVHVIRNIKTGGRND